MRLKPLAISFLFFVFPAFATSSFVGTSGIINMPDARVGADGTFSLGYSYDRPYSTLWTALTILPNLQMTGRFVGIRGISGFEGKNKENYGSYKDKVIDLKLRLLDEGYLTPAIAIGRTDTFGTGLFESDFVTMSKNFGPVDASIGFGQGRIDGPFGGVRWQIPYGRRAWTLLAEYDAVNYANDFRADQTFAKERKAGAVVGLEYRWGWLAAQLSRSRSHTGLNAFVNIPLSEKEFVPKIFEPAPYTTIRQRPSQESWHVDYSHRNSLLEALHKQNYKTVNISYRHGVMSLDLTNTRVSNIGRAVGRAVRTALYFTPLETRVIKVRYRRSDLALAEYEFFSLPHLNDYLNGKLTRDQFRDFVLVKNASSSAGVENDEVDGLALALSDGVDVELVSNEDGESFQVRGQDKNLNRFSLAPKVGMYFNDPSGALRYEINAQASSQLRLAPGHFLDTVLTYKVVEDVSKVDNPSNSLLPHVRTDIAEYKRGNPFRLNQLAYTHVFQPAERFYGKFSVGLFEEMFSGFAGQFVYFPKSSRWIAELSTEAVQQRDYAGWFGRRDYKTITGLASLHYKLPNGVTLTGRAGRFLAKDSGVRFEFKRRFRSGIEAGAWYTYTDGKDITNPGSPSNPYHDRGLFMAIPFDSMLPADTQSAVKMSISPWTRDVGQTVEVPHNLMRQLEDPARQLALDDAMGNLAEHSVESVASELPDPAWWPSASGIRMRLDGSVAATPEVSDVAVAGTLGAVAIAAASTRDKKAYQYIQNRKDNKLLSTWGKVGSGAPLLAVGAAGTAMLLSDDPVMINTSIVSMQSAALAAGLSLGTKRLVNRARPSETTGSHWKSSESDSSSFPSNHAAVTMAAITPFAEEYQVPWLYAAAGLASAGRVVNGKHWVSDAVAGSLLGYGIGHWLWKGQRNTLLVPSVSTEAKTLGLNISHQY